MIVVADTSPLIVLISTMYVDVLPRLFGSVLLPPEVEGELQSSRRPNEVRRFIAQKPFWLQVQSPKSAATIPQLQPAEAAAIQLAIETNADLLLIDELKGRRAAALRNLKLTGTIGVLELAATRGLIELSEAFERVKQTDFWISNALLDERLRLFNERLRPQSRPT